MKYYDRQVSSTHSWAEACCENEAPIPGHYCTDYGCKCYHQSKWSYLYFFKFYFTLFLVSVSHRYTSISKDSWLKGSKPTAQNPRGAKQRKGWKWLIPFNRNGFTPLCSGHSCFHGWYFVALFHIMFRKCLEWLVRGNLWEFLSFQPWGLYLDSVDGLLELIITDLLCRRYCVIVFLGRSSQQWFEKYPFIVWRLCAMEHLIFFLKTKSLITE